MGKAVMISIRPKWCQKIANGEKTIEIRKTRPRLGPPFKCYIYCTQGGVALGMWGKHGKVIGEFVCDRIDTLVKIGYMGSAERPKYHICKEDFRSCPAAGAFAKACLTETEAEGYLGGKTGFGWHILDLVIYDTPKELSEFWTERICTRGNDRNGCVGCWDCEKHAPQSWCYVEES